MYRHISVFTLENKEDLSTFLELLKEISKCPIVLNNEIGTNISEQPPFGPDFGDVIQIVDFKTQEDLDAYPMTNEHQRLVNDGPKMKKVTAIDYIVDK